MIKYIVQPGDMIYSISRRFGVSLCSMFAVNPGLIPEYFMPGRKIVITVNLYRDAVYNILGTTTRLTEAQMRNIAAGRRYIVELARKNPGEIYINGPTTKKRVALTFVDGPDSWITPRVLDILKTNNVKANFFFVGTQMGYFPDVVKRAYNEGHLILNHGFSHPHFTEMDPQGIKKQIISTEEKIESILGRRPSFVRPPYGEVDENVLSTVRATGNKIVIWSIDTMDWVPKVDKQTVVENVLNNVRLGEIILMHSGPGQRIAVEALPEIIRGLRARGFSIVDLGVMLDVNPYKET
ncbi:polysaccharide deacetylase family protein [Fonticella tunisiensis]|uniref:Peptidoglycan/xylan/chitin deacetylase (PgdA/CDA1 family) n=1 Tax=Fonticella tunisiensis TaxID=1096341 RepID=A0A4R7KTX2_9CLOT|nr:polysaccharide deacetylase family protein [Fonticella tunisiensis]TDT63587.1 peptidoglycan/xylan/chitin deacetylase (PgdA/CDA1 family) [Fonticella tunisiensis]